MSFHEGDIIQVITPLKSGWWDGVINGVRGWFPSNYCQVILTPGNRVGNTSEDNQGDGADGEAQEDEEDEEYEDQYEEEYEEDGGDEEDSEWGRNDFWIPQSTPDGRLFYFNTETGESSMELPILM